MQSQQSIADKKSVRFWANNFTNSEKICNFAANYLIRYMELASKYDPKEVESKWYQYWLDNKLFASKPDGREPYTIVIPPPNVTGVLHMGHMLNNTIQDILVRRARMEGKNACWVPGTDHASIATEAKVVKKLAEQGIKKHDLTREEFLKHAWDWTDEHGGIILKQLRRLGASCDWDRTAFTMDEKRSKVGVAKACGYPYAVCVDSVEALDSELEAAKRRNALSLIEVKCSIGARENLGRPTTTALENKQNFMAYLGTLS